MYSATAVGGCAALCGGSPAKLPGFETYFEIFVHAHIREMTGVISILRSHG